MDNNNVIKRIEHLHNLHFLEFNKIKMSAIEKNLNELKNFLNILNQHRRGKFLNKNIVEPLFSINSWSCYSQVLLNIPQTRSKDGIEA